MLRRCLQALLWILPLMSRLWGVWRSSRRRRHLQADPRAREDLAGHDGAWYLLVEMGRTPTHAIPYGRAPDRLLGSAFRVWVAIEVEGLDLTRAGEALDLHPQTVKRRLDWFRSLLRELGATYPSERGRVLRERVRWAELGIPLAGSQIDRGKALEAGLDDIRELPYEPRRIVSPPDVTG